MAVEITMPQLSDTMSEGKILSWRKKEGDRVSRGEALAEVATDKADLEIESFHEGVLLKINASEGTTVKVGSVIALIGEAGESAGESAAPTQGESQPPPQPSQVVTPPAASYPKPEVSPAPEQPQEPPAPQPYSQAQQPPRPTQQPQEGERVKISPLAKNIADSRGIDYRNLQGSGEGGRIVRRDIESAAAEGAPAAASARAPEPSPAISPAPARPQPAPAGPLVRSAEPLSKMRQTIAQRMVESKTTIPHFVVTSKINARELGKVRNSLKSLPQYEGLTFNHMIIRACALALKAVPRINAGFDNGNLSQPQAINIGIVTAVPDGLLIPVVKNADSLSLSDIVCEARALVQRARAGRPKPEDLLGGTFSISNMGLFAVESFTAIINPGQGAILAVSSIGDEPVIENGQVVPGSVFRVSLSVDHRIIDGVVAGEFVTELKRLLEDPVILLA